MRRVERHLAAAPGASRARARPWRHGRAARRSRARSGRAGGWRAASSGRQRRSVRGMGTIVDAERGRGGASAGQPLRGERVEVRLSATMPIWWPRAASSCVRSTTWRNRPPTGARRIWKMRRGRSSATSSQPAFGDDDGVAGEDREVEIDDALDHLARLIGDRRWRAVRSAVSEKPPAVVIAARTVMP